MYLLHIYYIPSTAGWLITSLVAYLIRHFFYLIDDKINQLKKILYFGSEVTFNVQSD